MTEHVQPLSLTAAAQAIIRGLRDHPVCEIAVARESGRLITSETLRQAVLAALAQIPPTVRDERFRYLDNFDVQLKGADSAAVKFCAYRFYR